MASTSVAGKGDKGGRPKVGDVGTSSEEPIELFSEWEFRECFHILHGVSIRLMDGGPVPTEKELFNATIFSKEQFNAGLHFLFLHSLSSFFTLQRFP